MGAPRASALCHCFLGALEFQSGNWDRAVRELRDAVELYRQVGSASGESLSLQRLGVLLTAQGEVEEARQRMDEGIVVAERAAMRSHCLTRLHASLTRNRLAAKDLEGAQASLAEGLEAARRHGHCVTCNALLLPEAVRVSVAAGCSEAAREHAEHLTQIASRFESKAWAAMAATARGRVALASGDHGTARVAFEEARAAFEEVGQPYEAARCVLLRAEAEAAAGEGGRAEASAKLARAAFSAVGAAGIEP